MSDSGKRRLTAGEARALWERALEMQLEAARRAEERALASGEDERTGEDWDFTAAEVAAAAREAGISPEFMDAALAELEAGGANAAGPEGRVDRVADRLLDDPRKTLEVSRTVTGSPEEIIGAMGEILPASPFFLTLKDVKGDPLADGVLVFAAPGWSEALHHQTPFVNAMMYGGLEVLFVTVRRPARNGEYEEGDPPARSEVVIRAPLRGSRRSHWWWAVGLGAPTTLGAGGVGLALGLVIGGAALAPPLAALAGLSAAAAAAGGAGAGNVWAFRKMFRWGIGKAGRALDDLLSAVDVRIRSGAGFRIPDTTRKDPPASGSFPWYGTTFRSR